MNLLKKFKKEDWEYLGLWKQSLLSACYWTDWQDEDVLRSLGIKLTPGNVLVVSGHFFVKREALNELKDQLEVVIKRKDYRFIESLFKRSLKIIDESIRNMADMKNSYPNTENIDKFDLNARRIMSIWCLNVLFSKLVEDFLLKQTEKEGISYKKVMDAFPIKKTLVMKQQIESLKIKKELKKKNLLYNSGGSIKETIKRIEKEKELWDQIQSHIDEFGWLEIFNFIGAPLTIEKFLESLENSSVKKVSSKTKPTFSKELKFLGEMVQKISFLRQYGAESFSVLTYKAYPFLHKLAKDLGLSYRDFIELTVEEIKELLKNDIDLVVLIKKRQKGYSVFMEGNDFVVNEDYDNVETFIEASTPKADSSTELRGTIANPGYVKGKAKIIFCTDDFEKMKKGDVLITTMTTPDFILLMKKSSAIITDIGGLLSHAAIISRELGKPCIIGTKVATQLLKDGDLVEVDANKGVARKLK